MQRPIIKDGVVINVIEIGDDTAIVTKNEHKRRCAEEEADYQSRLQEWRLEMKTAQSKISEAMDKVSIARATVAALEAQATLEKNDAKVAAAFRQIQAVKADVAVLEQKAIEVQKQPVAAKPKLMRAKRWFHPEGLEVGPAGGNIGDIWNGQEYVRPVKPALEKAAEPAV